MTAIVRPPTRRAPRCASPSMPRAPPETIASPHPARSAAKRPACSLPYTVHRRDPTIARASRSAPSSRPRSHNAAGGVEVTSRSGGYSASPRSTSLAPAAAIASRSAAGSAVSMACFSPAASAVPSPPASASRLAAAPAIRSWLPRAASSRPSVAGPRPAASSSRKVASGVSCGRRAMGRRRGDAIAAGPGSTQTGSLAKRPQISAARVPDPSAGRRTPRGRRRRGPRAATGPR